jgi:hypothetical protein
MPIYTGSTPIQGIFNNYPVRTFKPVNFDALALLTGMEAGDWAIIPGNGAQFEFYGGWVQTSPARFTNTTLRDSAYATAGGAYRVAGAQAVVGAITYQHNGTAWKPYNSEWTTYTPALTGITLGTGGSSAFTWKYSSGQVKIKALVTLGTGGTWNLPSATLPVPVESAYVGFFAQLGTGIIGAPGDFAPAIAHYVDATTGMRFYYLVANTPTVKWGLISASAPIAVVAGMTLSITAEYTPN